MHHSLSICKEQIKVSGYIPHYNVKKLTAYYLLNHYKILFVPYVCENSNSDRDIWYTIGFSMNRRWF